MDGYREDISQPTPMLRVLIPSCTDSLLDSCFRSMEACEKGSVRSVIVGDNGLSRSFRRLWPTATYLTIHTPFIYSQAINSLASRHPQSDLLILGDDSQLLTAGWLTRCEQQFHNWPRAYGLLNLSEPSTSSIYQHHTSSGYLDPIPTTTLVAFVGTLIPRRVWRLVGQMDARFVGYGYDDFDWQIRLLHYGLSIGISSAAIFRHLGSGTYSNDRSIQVSTNLNLDLFFEKHGFRPEGFAFSSPHLNYQECNCNRA